MSVVFTDQGGGGVVSAVSARDTGGAVSTISAEEGIFSSVAEEGRGEVGVSTIAAEGDGTEGAITAAVEGEKG